MKRIALVLALVVMAAGACKKAQQSGSMAADSARMADSIKMADSMKMTATDTTHHKADTSKARMDTSHARRPARRPTTTRRP